MSVCNARAGLSFEVHSTSSFTPCGFGKHSRVARDHFFLCLARRPWGGRRPGFCSALSAALVFHRESGPSSRQMMMSALAGVVVAAGTQVSRPRPRPRDGCRAGSVGRDEQRRQGPRVITPRPFRSRHAADKWPLRRRYAAVTQLSEIFAGARNNLSAPRNPWNPDPSRPSHFLADPFGKI